MNNHVIGLAGARIGVVQPTEDDVEPAEVAAVFVWNKVVRVVSARVLVVKRADELSGDFQTGHDAERSIGIVWYRLDDRSKIVPYHLARPAVFGRRNLRLFGQAHI